MKVLENKSKIEELKDVPVFVIWDTISKGLAQDGATQSRMNAMDRARVIKNYMSPVMAEIEKQDFILCLLNQVIYNVDSYGNRKMDSGGGIALKHDVHFSTRITPGSDEWNGNFKTKTRSVIAIDKSKLGPEIWNIPMVIDNQEGGVIDEVMSFVDYLIELGFITNAKGWYNFNDLLDREKLSPFYQVIYENNKSYRYDDLISMFKSNRLMYNIMRYMLMEFLAGMYKLQAKVMKSYKEQCLQEIRKEYDPAELYLRDNNDEIEIMINNLIESDADIPSKVEDCKAICLDCGTVSDYVYTCDHCGGSHVVTRETAKSLLNRLNPAEEPTEEESTDEEITE